MNQYDNNKALIIKAVIIGVLLLVPAVISVAHYQLKHRSHELKQQQTVSDIGNAFGTMVQRSESQLQQFATNRLKGVGGHYELPGEDQYWIQGDTIERLKGHNNFDMVALFSLVQDAAQYPFSLTIGTAIRPQNSANLMVPLALAVQDKRFHDMTGIVISFVPVESWISSIKPLLDDTSASLMVVDYKRHLLLSTHMYDSLKQDGFLETSLQLFQFDRMFGRLQHPIEFDGTRFSWYSKMQRYPFILMIGSPISNAPVLAWYGLWSGVYYLAVSALWFGRRKYMRHATREERDEQWMADRQQPPVTETPVPASKNAFAKPTKELELID